MQQLAAAAVASAVLFQVGAFRLKSASPKHLCLCRRLCSNLDDALTKWERMYNRGADTTVNLSTPASQRSVIRVVTFDLDNTLWKTDATISDANDALAAHLQLEFGIATRSEVRMRELFSSNPQKYAGIDCETQNDIAVQELMDRTADKSNRVNVKTPVYLSQLRKDAIRSMMMTSGKEGAISNTDLEHKVDKAFDVWMEGRVKSISQNLVPLCLPTLEHIRSKLSSDDRRLFIGAITDGNSNPTQVPELNNLFDFVIRAEDVGVAKPDRRIFKAAVAALLVQLAKEGVEIEEFFFGKQSFDTGYPSWKDQKIDDEAVKEKFAQAVAPWWVHIGDDFFKDCVAAKECRMRTVWMRELIIKNKAAVLPDPEPQSNGGNQRSTRDLVEDMTKSSGSVLKMTIGESEYLQSSLQDEFADATVDQFSDLGRLLPRWHQEGAGEI